MASHSFTHHLRRFLARVFVGKTPRIGLEVSDQAVRILYERRGQWQLEQIALPPGTVVQGRVMNPPVLLQALMELRKRAAGGDNRHRVGIHVSLTSAPVYTQLVGIPQVADDEFAAAVELNVQVSAPVALSELAWGWQPITTQGTASVLAAWTARDLVDQLVELLAQAQFLPASLEPKVLSLARLAGDLVPGVSTQSLLLVSVDEIGITIAVLDSGTVRFQSSVPWREIQGASSTLTYPVIETFLRREIPQVMGFYAQRAGVRVTQVLLATPTFLPEITATLQSLGCAVQSLVIGNPPFPLHGYAAFGAALRGSVFATSDDHDDLSLLGGQVREWLRRELVVRVARFWTLVAPLSLLLLLGTFGASLYFVDRIHTSILANSVGQASPALLAELADRESRAQRFNDLVTALARAQADTKPKAPVMRNLLEKANTSGVTITGLRLPSDPASVMAVSGTAGGEDQLLSFKRSLEADPIFSAVTLPIADIRSGPDGLLFSISFKTDFAAAAKPAL